MANPNGTPENLRPRPPWQKGQSGNPAGHSKQRRIQAAAIRLIEEKGLDSELGMILLAKATGRRDLLIERNKDGSPKKGKNGRTIYRKPEFQWFSLLHQIVDGPLPKAGEEPPQEAERPTMDAETAARLLKAMDADGSGDAGDDDGPAE